MRSWRHLVQLPFHVWRFAAFPGGRRRFGALALSLALLAPPALASCTTVTTQQSPGAMDLSIKIKYYQQGATPVEAHFSTTDGNTVEFVSGETVACNGQFLAYESNPVEQLFDYGSYVGEAPIQPAGGAYTFTYTPAQGKGSPISIPVQVVNAPVDVTSPANGATVSLPTGSDSMTIQYVPSSLANTQILAILVDSRGKATFTLPEPEHGTINVSASQLAGFQPGPGTIYVVRVTTNMPGGTPFHQVRVEYDNITIRQVMWQ